MPCYEPESSPALLQKTADMRTQQLCELCAILEAKELTWIIPQRTLSWWKKHKEWDAREGRCSG